MSQKQEIILIKPNDSIVGNPTAVVVKAVNDFGAIDTLFNGVVTFYTSGSAIGGGIITFTSGVAIININDNVAETINLFLSNNSNDQIDISSIQNVVFVPDNTAQFIINDPGDALAGVRSGYTITRKDQYGNLVTSGINTVYLYTNSTGNLGRFYNEGVNGNIISSVNIGDGQSNASFWYEEDVAGHWTVTVSDKNTYGAENAIIANDPIIISPSSVHDLSLSDPGNMSVGTRLGYVVTRKDIFGNLITTGLQNINLASSSLSPNYSFYDQVSSGEAKTSIVIPEGESSANFWYFDDTAGIYTITVSSPSVVDATDSVAVSDIQIVATKFVIRGISDALVGNDVVITITAEDDNGNIATLFNNDVTLLSTGNAAGGGIIHIKNGVGTVKITDTLAETILLSLDDSAATGLNYDSTHVVAFNLITAPVASSGATAIVVVPTFAINFSGKASPGSLINILGIPEGGNIKQAFILNQQLISSKKGSFKVGLNNPDTKSSIYVVSLTDKNHISSQYKIFTNISDVANLNNIVFAPTISLSRSSVRKADFLSVDGYSTPGATVSAQFDGNIIADETTTATADGSYKILISTSKLDLGRHTVRVRSTINSKPSEYSLDRSFIVSNLFRPIADLNNDGVVDIRDINIFDSIWRSSDPESRTRIDFNFDGKVDLQDLSIFIQALKH